MDDSELAFPSPSPSAGDFFYGGFMWDEEDVEFARNQLTALGKAVYSHAMVYVDFPSALQALALTEIVTELTKAVTFFEANRKEMDKEGVQ
jgi:hypothetical protein